MDDVSCWKSETGRDFRRAGSAAVEGDAGLEEGGPGGTVDGAVLDRREGRRELVN